MKSTISYLKILAGASCVLSLAACDAIKDVPNEITGNPPAPTVVLSGEINGLSSLRSITLQNNDDVINTKSFINAAPSTPNAGVRPVPFSFGAIAVGTPYNITVKTQPELKTCVVVNGQGVLTEGVRPDIVINCTNTGSTRFNLVVSLPSDPALFTGLAGAKVRVTTEEEIQEKTVASGDTSVTFPGVVISAPGALNAATYSVTASTFEGNRLNKCVVSRPSNTVNPTGNVTGGTAPAVGAVAAGVTNATTPACQFTVSGAIGYSLPVGATVIPTISGLKLQLRDLQARVIEELTVGACTPASAAVTTTTQTTTLGATVPVPTPVLPAGSPCTYKFATPIRSSATDGVYDIVVSEQPTGQSCIVVNGGSVSVFTTGLTPPASATNANVFCRALPAANKQLQGIFRLQSTTFVPNAITGSPAPLVSTWRPFDLTQWNTASSNMMAFYNNGTFLYGTHANGAQVEHGFYDYDPDAQTMRFTSIVDTNISTTFPANFSPLPTIPPGSTFTQITNLFTTTPGLSALPNPIRQNGTGFAASHAAMTGVTLGTANSGLGTVRTISGTFGADPAGITSYALNTTVACSVAAPCLNPTTGALITAGTCTTADPCVNATSGQPPVTTGSKCIAPAAACYMPNYAYRVSWTLQEPPQVEDEMTGAWLGKDGRRFWVWDFRTYYGTSVGVLGGSPSMNDGCFTMEDLHVSEGIYTRRGSGTGCYPYARPANDPVTGAAGQFFVGNNGTFPGYLALGAESVDFSLTPLTSLPGYTGRMPGGEPAPGTSSPSPIYFRVAPAGSFFTSENELYFPSAGQSTSWCNTEILGVRATANGFPINYPVYFCRTSATVGGT